MSNNPRDTQFAGFADALAKKLDREVAGIGIEEWTPTRTMTMTRRIIAQASYDLVEFAVKIMWYQRRAAMTDEIEPDELCQLVRMLPDMPVLPER